MADETEPDAVEQTPAEPDNAVTTVSPDGATDVSDASEPAGDADDSVLSDEDVDGLLAQAQQAEQQIGSVEPDAPEPDRPFALPELAEGDSGRAPQGFDLLDDVQLEVKIELGRCEMYVDEVLRLSEGAVVQLDKLAGDPVDILVNDKLVARGEVLVLNDSFCVRVGEMLQPDGQ